jgi:hypothetical protein
MVSIMVVRRDSTPAYMQGGLWMKSYEKCEYGIDLAQRLNFMWTKDGLG